MRPKARFIKSVIDAAKDCQTDMPWARKTRRNRASASRKPMSPTGVRQA